MGLDGRRTGRSSSRAASSSGSPSPSRSPTHPRSCSRTSRPASSTASPQPEVFEVLHRANAELGTTVVVVTHDPMVTERVARTVAIRDGRTASVTLRRTEQSGDGHRVIAEEFAVLDRRGRPAPLPASARWNWRTGPSPPRVRPRRRLASQLEGGVTATTSMRSEDGWHIAGRGAAVRSRAMVRQQELNELPSGDGVVQHACAALDLQVPSERLPWP